MMARRSPRSLPSAALALAAALVAACGGEASQPGAPPPDAVAIAADAAADAPSVDASTPDAAAFEGGAPDVVVVPPPDATLAEVASPDGPSAAACPRDFCPRLFETLVSCRGTSACQYQSAGMGADYCFGNGAMYSVRSMLLGTRLEMTTQVRGPGGREPCYSVVTSADLSGGVQDVTWRDPTGRVIATGVATGENITVTCSGATMDVSASACGGLLPIHPDGCAMGPCP